MTAAGSRTLVVPVVVDRWQMECCGHPPGVGDVVSWRLRWSPEEADLLPTDLDLRTTVERWDPGDEDPGFGVAPTLRDGSDLVPALATRGPLRAFVRSPAPVPHHLVLHGVLHEDHHVDTPLNLPTTTGTIRSVHLVSFAHDLVPGRSSRRWELVPGTARLEPVSRSPRWLPDHPPADGRTRGWRPGPSMVLVRLEVART